MLDSLVPDFFPGIMTFGIWQDVMMKLDDATRRIVYEQRVL